MNTNPYDTLVNEVCSFTLASGKEMIARVTDHIHHESDCYLVLSEPATVAFTPQGMHLVPSSVTANTKNGVHLNTKNIELFSIAQEAAKHQYVQAVTGIVTPSRQIITG